MARARLASRLLDAPLRWLAVGTGLLALAVSGLFGGWAPTHARGPSRVKVGAVSAGLPWNVTIRGARVVTDLSPMKPAHEGDRWFIVLARVEVTADQSRNDIGDAVSVSGVPGIRPGKPRVLLSSDATEPSFLHPGLAENVGFLWEQSAAAPMPTRAEVRIYSETLRADTLTDTATATGRMSWLDRRVRAVVVTPVEDRRG